MTDMLQGQDSRQTKKMEIEKLLQQSSNNVEEGLKIVSDINTVLFQEKANMPEVKQSPAPECERSRGWFDTVIMNLENIRGEAEKTNLQLSKLHQEIVK